MGRLAVLEKKLLREFGPEMFPSTSLPEQKGCRGFVSIIKNYGSLVGGSLTHGHQQVIFNNIMPRCFNDDWLFEQERGEPFTAYLLRENPFEFLVRDYGPAMLLVPFFMRRPYDMLLIVKDTSKTYLHELTAKEMEAVAAGWHDAIRAIHIIMPRIKRDVAFNVTTHNGPGSGLYFEFLPYTQEIGGFEHIGLFSCQTKPHDAAVYLRNVLS
jgi:galactose-1-phosphate uridylyltransferase